MREAVEGCESVAWDMHADELAAVPFRSALPGMVRKAAVLGYGHMSRDTEIEDTLADEIGRQPREDDYASREAYEAAIREYMDDLKQTEQYQAWYNHTIEPTLTISRQVGNWYTGSVHIARIAALQYAAEKDRNLAGEKLLVGLYGSGPQAEIHAETVQPNWQHEIDQLKIDPQPQASHDYSLF